VQNLKHFFAFFVLLSCSFVTGSFAGSPLDFSLRGDRNNVAALQDFRGKELLVYVMSFDCRSCLLNLPTIEGLRVGYPQRLAVLGVVYGAKAGALEEKSRQQNLKFPLVHGSQEYLQASGIDKTPSVIWYDAEGRLKDRFIGSLRLAQLSLCLSAKEGIGLAELAAAPERWQGERVKVSGVLQQERAPEGTSPLRPGQLLLSNGRESVPVKAWLPFESIKAPPEKEKQTETMQRYLGRPITVSGKMVAGRLEVEQAQVTENQTLWKGIFRPGKDASR
jgi:hypothetical protein